MNFIYHGTSATGARSAIAEGLRPRGTTSGNWVSNDGLFSSHSDWVYLTRDAPLYYAGISVNDLEKEEKVGAVIRLDFDRLDKSLLRCDEDFFYLQNPSKVTDDPEEKSKKVDLGKRKAEAHPEMWPKSLERCGSVAYVGIISPEAFVDVRLVDFKFYSVLHGALAELGEKVPDRSNVLRLHNELMRWLFGRAINKLPLPIVDELVELAAAQNVELPIGVYRMTHSDKIKNLRRRDGLQIHNLTGY